jgi:hypothetical protein
MRHNRGYYLSWFGPVAARRGEAKQGLTEPFAHATTRRRRGRASRRIEQRKHADESDDDAAERDFRRAG